MDKEYSSRGAPWDWQPSLEAMCEEIKVDFHQLVAGFKVNKNDEELASELGVNAKTVYHLRDHFERFGIDSVMGLD